MKDNFKIFFEKEYEKNICYKGVNIAGILFNNYFLEKQGIIKMKKEFYLKEVANIFLNFFYIKEIKYHVIDKKKEFKLLFLLNMDIATENKKSEILEKIIPEFEKEDILLITFSEVTYKKYKERNYNIIYIKIPKCILKLSLIGKTQFKYLRYLSKVCYVIDIYEKILEKYNFKILLTTQDHEAFDYSLTMLAKRKNIKTITHQHGIFIENLNLQYVYYRSDYLILWGEKSKELLLKVGIDKKIFIAGTEKFNFLLENRKKEKKNIVLCMTNSGKKEEEKLLIEKFNSLKYDEGEKIIKIHPSIDLKEFQKKYHKLNVKISKDYNEILKAKYLITYETTAFLDGLFSGASVLNIKMDNNLKYNIPCEVNIESLEKELSKRIKEKEYFNKVKELQEEELRLQVLYKDSTLREKNIIEKILKDIDCEG